MKRRPSKQRRVDKRKAERNERLESGINEFGIDEPHFLRLINRLAATITAEIFFKADATALRPFFLHCRSIKLPASKVQVAMFASVFLKKLDTLVKSVPERGLVDSDFIADLLCAAAQQRFRQLKAQEGATKAESSLLILPEGFGSIEKEAEKRRERERLLEIVPVVHEEIFDESKGVEFYANREAELYGCTFAFEGNTKNFQFQCFHNEEPRRPYDRVENAYKELLVATSF